jgi:putative ABC transport system permease protein
MTILTDQRVVPDSERSPVAARRAVVRWAWRLFRREWRQQVLILILLVVAVAVTVIGAGAATNGPQPPSAQMGAANNIVYISAK